MSRGLAERLVRRLDAEAVGPKDAAIPPSGAMRKRKLETRSVDDDGEPRVTHRDLVREGLLPSKKNPFQIPALQSFAGDPELENSEFCVVRRDRPPAKEGEVAVLEKKGGNPKKAVMSEVRRDFAGDVEADDPGLSLERGSWYVFGWKLKHTRNVFGESRYPASGEVITLSSRGGKESREYVVEQVVASPSRGGKSRATFLVQLSPRPVVKEGK